MKVLLSAVCVVLLGLRVEAGYYPKVRAPPPPHPPPAMIQYGNSHHPSHYHHKSHSHHHSHPPFPPSSHHSHSHYHPPSYSHSPSRPRFGPPRDYRPHHSTSKYSYWKSPNAFRAPSIKETFHPPPSLPYAPTPSYLKDDDKGPIHTIPAPNLSPADKPAGFKDDFFYKKPNADLAAVLSHGIKTVHLKHHSPGYQVTEDPSLHSGDPGAGQFFAPDPDPSLPTVTVPPTTDPHSQPSNGQIPLDLYLQEQAEKLNAPALESNALTAQDLFNLMHYQNNLIPQSQLQHHVLQPNVQFYSPLLLPQQSTLATPAFQHFSPQYQTFNYDEQTQQGAYGSDSFPAASMPTQLFIPNRNNYHDVDAIIKDNEVAGSSRDEVYQKNEIAPENEVKTEKFTTKKLESAKYPGYYTSLTSKQAAQALATLSAAGALNNISPATVSPTVSPSTTENSQEDDSSDEILKQDENVQVQKSIKIYETTYSGADSQQQDSSESSDKPNTSAEFSEEDYAQEEASVPQKQSRFVTNNNVPFGSRIRPKRF